MIKIIEITALAHLENRKGKFLYRKKKKRKRSHGWKLYEESCEDNIVHSDCLSCSAS